mmetsp:Transcript_82681/g.129184  ORF Transcript_82681/g.129184 Transcript_82681/m.129184 type:complete len:90 (+) Transcript_82681:272-541(+)
MRTRWLLSHLVRTSFVLRAFNVIVLFSNRQSSARFNTHHAQEFSSQPSPPSFSLGSTQVALKMICTLMLHWCFRAWGRFPLVWMFFFMG